LNRKKRKKKKQKNTHAEVGNLRNMAGDLIWEGGKRGHKDVTKIREGQDLSRKSKLRGISLHQIEKSSKSIRGKIQ